MISQMTEYIILVVAIMIIFGALIYGIGKLVAVIEKALDNGEDERK